MITRLIALYVLSVISLSVCQAQPLHMADRALTTANGLPSATITAMAQDRAGFIWIATADGLARYDGQRVKVFQHHDGPHALLENNILRLQLLANGTFLLQTNTGDFQQFDPVTERFTTFLPLAKQGHRKIDDGELTVDGQTFWGLWRGEKIQVFDHQLHLLCTWDQRTLGAAAQTLHSLVVASNGRAYAHSDAGLLELNAQTGHHRLFPFQGPAARRLNTITPVVDWEHVVERPNGEIMVIGQQYLHLFNPQTNQFRGLILPGDFNQPGAYALRVLANGSVYLTIGNTLYELLPTDQFMLVHQWTSSTGEQRSFGIPYLCDHTGVVWLYTHTGEITRLRQQPQAFKAYRYRVRWTTDLLRVGIGITLPPAIETSGASWTRFTQFRGRLWFLNKGALYRCSPDQHLIEQTSSYATGDSCLFKIALKPDQQGHLWVYGNEKGGLTEMDSAGRVQRFWPNSLVPQPLEKRGLDVGDIQPMGSAVWMASYQGKGLYKYDRRQQKIVAQLLHNPANAQSLPTNQLLGLLADPHQPTRVLWIGTAGYGLTRFDTQTNQFRTFTMADGLPNNTINSLQADGQGFLWAGTSKGLLRLDTRTFRMQVFNEADGLPDDEFVFAASTQLPGGRLAFGSRTGLIIFDPAAIREHTAQTPLVLSALRINNELVEANTPASPLPRPINALTNLTLNYSQNFLTFEMAGLDYTKPDQIQYRHRLLGVDRGWVNTGTQNTANYTQLRPDDYVFEAAVTNPDGQWSTRVKRLAITITPPFWATWWAYVVYALTFGGVALGYIRFRVRQGRQRQEMVLQRQQAEQLKAVDELKTRFFSNITHEFRTPLSLILSPVEKLLQEPKHDATTRQTLTLVQRNAGQLLQLINQLLDLSKLEAGGMAVSQARGNPGEFIEWLVDSFQPAAQPKNLTLTLTHDIGPQEVIFDAEKWTKIVTNLIANAIKFTPNGGQITVGMAVSRPGVVGLTVADTGIGIRAEKLPHIFDRFYQVDDTHTRAYDGTGIGLALVKELIDLLGGSIAVVSEPGRGTTFTVELPIQTASATDMTTAIFNPKPPFSPLLSSPEVTRPVTNGAPETPLPLLLVVEDNTELRTFIAGELSSSYQILTAANGAEGWELARTELPDLVLSDVMMPVMDGYELTQHLKTSPITNHIGVILLSAKAAHESRMLGLTEGADDYLTKPFHVDELRQRLHNLVMRQQTLRAYYTSQLTKPDSPLQPETLDDPFLRQVHTTIDNYLDDSTFGVDELARQVGMSRRTLNRKLTAVANQSANDIIRQHRLKRAAQFLHQGLNVSETAYRVGYESSAHFSLIFREFFQKTPSEFIQR